MLGHPSRAGQMSVMNGACPRAVSLRVEPEQDTRRLGPVCSLLGGIEQAHIDGEVATIVIGQARTLRRRVGIAQDALSDGSGPPRFRWRFWWTPIHVGVPRGWQQPTARDGMMRRCLAQPRPPRRIQGASRTGQACTSARRFCSSIAQHWVQPANTGKSLWTWTVQTFPGRTDCGFDLGLASPALDNRTMGHGLVCYRNEMSISRPATARPTSISDQSPISRPNSRLVAALATGAVAIGKRLRAIGAGCASLLAPYTSRCWAGAQTFSRPNCDWQQNPNACCNFATSILCVSLRPGVRLLEDSCVIAPMASCHRLRGGDVLGVPSSLLSRDRPTSADDSGRHPAVPRLWRRGGRDCRPSGRSLSSLTRLTRRATVPVASLAWAGSIDYVHCGQFDPVRSDLWARLP